MSNEECVQKTLDSTAEKFTRTLDETAATLKKAINEKESQVEMCTISIAGTIYFSVWLLTLRNFVLAIVFPIQNNS